MLTGQSYARKGSGTVEADTSPRFALPHHPTPSPLIYVLVPRKARLMYLRFAWPRFAATPLAALPSPAGFKCSFLTKPN